MDLTDRIIHILVGVVLGYILSEVVRYLREIKEELDEVDECVKRCQQDHVHIRRRKPAKDERGFVRYPIVADIILLGVIAMVVWAAFASQAASNDVEKTQERLANISICNQQFLSQTITALNERTTYTQEATAANVELQRAQAAFLNVLLADPPKTDASRARALERYFSALTDFITVQGQSADKVAENPFPTNEELNKCLEEGVPNE